ncbi:MAG TPA: sodium-dependent transporter [Acidiferrobacteraceae bacterium]|nr:sodium-dependent transporter [Acidiferrobacteraceae bacterium]
MVAKTKKKYIHGQWSSRWTFVLAATGSAVGLGNIWKFPYITGANGGGAFVLVYLFCVAAIGVPIMMAEVMLGRAARQSPINALTTLAKQAGASKLWRLLGWMGVTAGFIILSYYSVIAGWALAYVFRSASGAFTLATADGVRSMFTDLVSDPERLLAWHTIFMVMTVVVIARGVRGGLEQAVRVLMPALFVLLVILVGYAMNTDYFMVGVRFLFTPDFSALSAAGVLTALGHAFFTLSLGMGAIMVYGSYLPKGTSIAVTSITISMADTVVALLAGLAIFPIVFANGLEPGAGPSLIFQTLPLAFGQMPGGVFFGTLFFILLLFAAWTSAISLLEPAVAWVVENHNVDRVIAASILGLLTWLLGIVTIMSFSDWAFSFDFFGSDEPKTSGMFDVLDILTANIMLPIGGMLIAIFAGWIMSNKLTEQELGVRTPGAYVLWLFLIRYISPTLVFIVLLHLFGVFQHLGQFLGL